MGWELVTETSNEEPIIQGLDIQANYRYWGSGIDIIHNSKVKASEFKAVNQSILNNESRRREIR